jgi:hypothetical protein
MRRLIWLPLAGALLTGGAAIGAASPGIVDDAARTVSELPGRGASLISEVLADLVGEDVITQDQSDAISTALDERVQQERADRQARHEELRTLAGQLRGFLEDDVITADEVAQLPDGELKTALQGLLVDGEITRRQLRDARAELGPLFGPGRGHGHGRGPGGFGPGFGPRDRDWSPAQDSTDDGATDSGTDGTWADPALDVTDI